MKRLFTTLTLSICYSTLLFAPINTAKIPELLMDKENIIPVAVIGGGPTGLAAAVNPARSGYHTVVCQGPKPGGELTDAKVVENWPGLDKASGAECMKKFETQVAGFGVHLVSLVVEDIDLSQWPYKLTLNDGTTAHAFTVIIATGSTQQKLGIEGEDIYWGKGLFSCGLCDGSFTRGKDTVVIGAGDFAIQRALQLACDAKKITLIAPGPHMTAHKSMQEKIKGIPSIYVLYNKEVTSICGTDKDITHVTLYDPTTKKTSTLNTSSVFLSTGLTPNTQLFTGKITCGKDGCLALKDGRSQQTAIEGVMAAGTVSDATYRQIAAINGDGTKAGMDAISLLSKWGFDGARRSLASTNLYKPPVIPHPLIKKLATICEFNRLLRAQKPLLVEVYSPNCPRCKETDGPLTALTEEFKTDLTVYKLDKDNDCTYSFIEKYDVNLIPAFLLFKNGKEVNRIEGETKLSPLRQFIKKGLSHQEKPVPQTS